VILMRFYISDSLAGGHTLKGDSRDTTDDTGAPYRMAVAWDTETGVVSFSVKDSCVRGSDFCPGQSPIRQGKNGANHINVSGGNGKLDADLGGLNSVLPCCSVEQHITIDLGIKGHSTVTLNGDNYPDFEAYQYLPGFRGGRLVAETHSNGGDFGGFSHPLFPNRSVTWRDGTKQ
jgi:hypothetical protein